MKDDNEVGISSKKELLLQMELIINRKLYNSNKITKDTYSKVEQNILENIEKI